MITRGAVSARKISGPKVKGENPSLTACFTSPSEKPPSGPISTRYLKPISSLRDGIASASPRNDRLGSTSMSFEKSLSLYFRKKSVKPKGSPKSTTFVLPHWRDDSSKIRCHRSSLWEETSLGIVLSETIGIIPATPNSV